MSKYCVKCGNYFPNKKNIDGKARILSSRKYCLDCSPFNSNNRRKLEIIQENCDKICKICGNIVKAKYHRQICHTCWGKVREKERLEKVYEIVGKSCWICGYDKNCKPAMDFHHVFPENKMFGITVRKLINISWENILTEIKKCIFICCRCHREIHAGLVDEDRVKFIYNQFWNK